MNYAEFVSKSKSMVVAPAGYGKTHAIADCLKYTEGKQLILTHTHAGVASLKEKIQGQGIGFNQYHVETIDSFAQKYVNAFYCGNDIPEQDDGKAYYPFIIKKAKDLFEITPIRDVIKVTYSGLFVDEYQDCTIAQHDLIKALGCILPTRILGDHLQGIFGFNGEVLVDFDKDLNDFEKFPDLSEPWRWKDKNHNLGKSLKGIRGQLERRINIDLNLWAAHIEIIQTEERDKHARGSDYNKRIWDLTNEDDVLIIHPDSSNLNVRKDFTGRFNNAFVLIEAIDSKEFYGFSKKFDSASTNDIYQTVHKIIYSIFSKTELDKWFNSDDLKSKRDKVDKNVIQPIKDNIEKLRQSVSFLLISETLKKIKKLPNIKCYRKELFDDLCRALEQAEHKGISVYEAMKEIRNIKRRIGRKVKGRCIGTTLLTKGLEFDTVAVLDAHKFKCPKNFYVAITRACRKLIIFTNNKILSPYETCRDSGDTILNY